MNELLLPVSAATLVTASEMVFGFLLAMWLGARFLPGLERKGYPLADGTCKKYELTGMTLYFMTHIALGIALAFRVSFLPVISHFWSVFIVANVVAVIVTLVLFLRRHRPGVLKYPHPAGTPLPEWLQDWWFGGEQNPDWLGVDLKMFLYQPSLIGVYVIIVSFAAVQHERHGMITPQMACLVAFWFLYLFTHYVKEEFMLSTWDVISENLGFMLVWGDLVYVPFLYSLPGWWLVDQTEPFSWQEWAALSVFFLFALRVFREANWQKERFKQDRDTKIWGKQAETVGGRLLVSGWWGVARKINYAGEIAVYVAFALTTGTRSPYPYLLPLSLIVLLFQRAARDDKKCGAKYGELWRNYCQRVRFRIFPYLY